MKKSEWEKIKANTTPWDASEYLDSEEKITAFLNAVFEEDGDDPAFIAKAFGHVAKARGMTQLAKKIKMSRSALYAALSGEGNPEFATILKVARGLGIKLRVA